MSPRAAIAASEAAVPFSLAPGTEQPHPPTTSSSPPPPPPPAPAVVVVVVVVVEPPPSPVPVLVLVLVLVVVVGSTTLSVVRERLVKAPSSSPLLTTIT